jgi:hypothetical protein
VVTDLYRSEYNQRVNIVLVTGHLGGKSLRIRVYLSILSYIASYRNRSRAVRVTRSLITGLKDYYFAGFAKFKICQKVFETRLKTNRELDPTRSPKGRDLPTIPNWLPGARQCVR